MMTTLRLRLYVISCCLAGFACGPFGNAMADETCNSPYMANLIKGQEDFLYVWTLGVQGMGDGADKLVTLDVNPKSAKYGQPVGEQENQIDLQPPPLERRRQRQLQPDRCRAPTWPPRPGFGNRSVAHVNPPHRKSRRMLHHGRASLSRRTEVWQAER